MKLAVSHHVLWNFSVGTFIKFADENFDGAELVDEPKANVWELRDQADAVKDQLSTTNLRITLHATYRDLNIASINPGVRQLSVAQVNESLEVAHNLGADVVTIHPGKVAGRKIPRADSMLCLTKSLKELSDYAEDLGVLLAIENMAGEKKLCKTAPEILEVLNAVDAENIGATIDFSHVYLMAISPKRTVDSLKDKLFNVHLSDSRGGSDHLFLGGGIVNLTEIFDLLHDIKYSRSIVMETWYSKDPLQGALASARAMVPLTRRGKAKEKAAPVASEYSPNPLPEQHSEHYQEHHPKQQNLYTEPAKTPLCGSSLPSF